MLGLVQPFRKLLSEAEANCLRVVGISQRKLDITFTSTGQVGWPRIDQRTLVPKSNRS